MPTGASADPPRWRFVRTRPANHVVRNRAIRGHPLAASTYNLVPVQRADPRPHTIRVDLWSEAIRMPRSAASLARLLPAPDPAPADAPLLRTFAATRSDDAFGELVRRHGPMVLATCRRALSNPDDAED